jgi:hypothetical protein
MWSSHSALGGKVEPFWSNVGRRASSAGSGSGST